MGRARGEIGAPARSMGGGLFSGLVRGIANKLPPNERVVTPEKKKGRPAPKADLTDTEIEECRRAYEAGEKTVKELAAMFGVSRPRMYRIVNCLTRSARTDIHRVV